MDERITEKKMDRRKKGGGEECAWKGEGTSEEHRKVRGFLLATNTKLHETQKNLAKFGTRDGFWAKSSKT